MAMTLNWPTCVKQWWRNDIRPLLILALVICAARSSLADWYTVPTGSMKPTIVEGDRVFVNKLAYDLKVPFTTWPLAEWSNPQRGEVVVFYSPYDGIRLVKRVIGLPGDVIELRHEHLFINGKQISYGRLDGEMSKALPENERRASVFASEQLPAHDHAVMAIPGIPEKDGIKPGALRDFGPVTVPAGHYFMMGDNRDNSFDSRYYGAVERKRILGRALGVVVSFDKSNYWLPRNRFFKSLDLAEK